MTTTEYQIIADFQVLFAAKVLRQGLEEAAWK